MMNKINQVPKKSGIAAPAHTTPNDSESSGVAGSYICSDDQIVMSCATMWMWMKPSYKKSALILVGMDSGLKKSGEPTKIPNANIVANARWDAIPFNWQEKLKRFFVQ